MAIIINSKFRPFSFLEMLLPVAMAALAHREIEDLYGALDAQASVWEKLKNSELDRDVYQLYKSYSDKLREASDLLAQQGLNPSSRRAMLDMRTRYAKEITPIEQAWNERDRLMKVQLEMMLKDPTHMYRVNAGNVRLRDYMNNTGYDALTDNYSGALLTQQVGLAASNLKQVLTDKGKLRSIGLPYLYERDLLKGVPVEKVMAAMAGDKNAAPILDKIVNDVIAASGIEAWNNPETLEKARAYARNGLYNAIGTTEIKNYTDSFGMLDALHARQFARQLAALLQQKVNNIAINPVNLYTPEERQKIDDNIKKFSQYFVKDADGRYRLTKKGVAEYNRRVSGSTTLYDKAYNSGNVFTKAALSSEEGQMGKWHEARMDKSSPSEFRKFVDGLTNNGKFSVKGTNDVFTQYMKDNDVTQYDAKKRTEFDYLPSESLKAVIKTAILKSLEGLDYADVVQFTKEGKFDKKDKIDIKDFDDKSFDILSTRFGPYGNTVLIKTKDGKISRLQMPAGSNPTMEGNRNSSMLKALNWQNKIQQGFTNPYDEAYALQLYKKALQDAYMYHSQLFGTNETETLKFGNYGI